MKLMVLVALARILSMWVDQRKSEEMMPPI